MKKEYWEKCHSYNLAVAAVKLYDCCDENSAPVEESFIAMQYCCFSVSNNDIFVHCREERYIFVDDAINRLGEFYDTPEEAIDACVEAWQV